MNQQQDFLIRYGIHNFVSYHAQGTTPAFLINKTAHHKMVRHAQELIQGTYGEAAQIRLA
jgi:hypothetical protein